MSIAGDINEEKTKSVISSTKEETEKSLKIEDKPDIEDLFIDDEFLF